MGRVNIRGKGIEGEQDYQPHARNFRHMGELNRRNTNRQMEKNLLTFTLEEKILAIGATKSQFADG